MLNHHVVKVTIRGYHLIKSFNTMPDAINFLATQSCRSGAVIYRDGTTGKRYAHNDAKQLIGRV